LNPLIERTGPAQLAKLLEASRSDRHAWTPSELEAMLVHQMSAGIEVDLGSLPPEVSAMLGGSSAGTGATIRTFRDLFTHSQPPVELLQLTKQFAKAMVYSPDSPIPAEIGQVLYLAAIVAAQVRCGQRITELDAAALREGIAWVLAQDWLDPALRGLFESGRSHLQD